jgi:hypothetical protein
VSEAVVVKQTRHKRYGRRKLGTFEYRSCISKRRYSVEPPLPNLTFRAYPCSFCNGWHLTHNE